MYNLLVAIKDFNLATKILVSIGTFAAGGPLLMFFFWFLIAKSKIVTPEQTEIRRRYTRKIVYDSRNNGNI